jgi:diguanylate cyclase
MVLTTQRYQNDRASSVRILRDALRRMGEHQAAFTPTTLTVWYEYCAGQNPGLSEAMDALLSLSQLLDDPRTAHLYEEHIASAEIRAAQVVAHSYTRLLGELLSSAREVGAHTEQFESTLKEFDEALKTGGPPPETIMRAMAAHTGKLRGTLGSMRHQLEQAQAKVEELQQHVEVARNMAKQADEAARTDALTGLANRRAYDEALNEVIERGEPAILLVCDIDHFKSINDRFLHTTGDDVLRKVGVILQNCAGAVGGLAARTGGEEFALLLRGRTLLEASNIAERIRGHVSTSTMICRGTGEPIGTITASFGVATRRTVDTPEDWHARADAALYEAKRDGRNCVRVAG